MFTSQHGIFVIKLFGFQKHFCQGETKTNVTLLCIRCRKNIIDPLRKDLKRDRDGIRRDPKRDRDGLRRDLKRDCDGLRRDPKRGCDLFRGDR